MICSGPEILLGPCALWRKAFEDPRPTTYSVTLNRSLASFLICKMQNHLLHTIMIVNQGLKENTVCRRYSVIPESP